MWSSSCSADDATAARPACPPSPRGPAAGRRPDRRPRRGRPPEPALAPSFPRELVLEVARWIAGNAAAVQHLNASIEGDDTTPPPCRQPAPRRDAGLAARTGLRPRLEGASSTGSSGPARISRGWTSAAELRAADLAGPIWRRPTPTKTCFHGADLQDAILNHWIAPRPTWAGPTSRRPGQGGRAPRGRPVRRLRRGRPAGGRLDGALIEDAEFIGANLEHAG